MFASTTPHVVPQSYPYRWSARASAIILFAIWLTLFVIELPNSARANPSIGIYGQVAALAVIFIGYTIGWRRELAGAIIGICGTVALFAVVASSTAKMPGLAAALFALPGVLYLLAWLDERGKLRTL